MLLSERWTKDTELTDSKQKRLIGTLCGKKTQWAIFKTK